jgi:hypothetical protein
VFSALSRNFGSPVVSVSNIRSFIFNTYIGVRIKPIY